MPAVQRSAAPRVLKTSVVYDAIPFSGVGETELIVRVGVAHFCPGEMLQCNAAGW